MNKYPITFLCIFLVVFVFVHNAIASLVPSLTLTPNTNTSSVQIVVFGADPNAMVTFNYPTSSAYQSVNLGSTNSSGNLSSSISMSSYNITPGSPVYVTIDGQSSPTQPWPNYTVSTATLPLSQTSLSMNVGQSAVITSPVSAMLSMSNNSSPSIAGASINGNQITINAFAFGSTNITICAGGLGCSVISVNVLSTTNGQNSITFNQTPITVQVGQSQAVPINGQPPFYIATNSNTAIATGVINGSSVIVGGVTIGADNLSICSSASGINTCNNLPIIVSPLSSVSTATTTLSFGQSEIDLSLGQSQTVPIYGGTSNSYILSANTSPSNVTASISNGSSLTLVGNIFGSSNITVCQSDNSSCGVIYVYVEASPTGGSVLNSSTTQPTLSTFSVSSNDVGNTLVGLGSRLTLSVTANQSINTPIVTLSGANILMLGTGKGPYVGKYTISGNEIKPISISIALKNLAGIGGQSYFWIGDSSTLTSTTVSAVDFSPVFTQLLNIGSTGSQVHALQQRLSDDGLYSGPITGTFGSLTETAVKKYQAKHGLNQLGIVGPGTRALLNKGI